MRDRQSNTIGKKRARSRSESAELKTKQAYLDEYDTVFSDVDISGHLMRLNKLHIDVVIGEIGVRKRELTVYGRELELLSEGESKLSRRASKVFRRESAMVVREIKIADPELAVARRAILVGEHELAESGLVERWSIVRMRELNVDLSESMVGYPGLEELAMCERESTMDKRESAMRERKSAMDKRESAVAKCELKKLFRCVPSLFQQRTPIRGTSYIDAAQSPDEQSVNNNISPWSLT